MAPDTRELSSEKVQFRLIDGYVHPKFMFQCILTCEWLCPNQNSHGLLGQQHASTGKESSNSKIPG